MMDFKEFISLSEQGMPPPMGGMGGPPAPPSGGSGQVPNFNALLYELLPRNMFGKGKLNKALKHSVWIAPNWTVDGKTQDLTAGAIKNVYTSDDGRKITGMNMTVMPPQPNSSTGEFVKQKKGKPPKEVRGDAVSTKKKLQFINNLTFNKIASPQKIVGGGSGAAVSGLPGPGGAGMMPS